MANQFKQQQQNYNALRAAFPDILTLRGHQKYTAAGYQDLSLEFLYEEDGSLRFAMAHYYKSNGDLVPDPDIEFIVQEENKTVAAQSFQNSISYDSVATNPDAATGLDEFLGMWLENIKATEYSLAK